MSDEAEVFELIRKLMRSQAGIITKLAPLLRQLNLSTEILDEHGDAISSLIEKLLGTREEHRQQRKSLEIIAGELADVKTRQESLGKHYQQLKKRLVKLESRPVQRLIYKLDEGKPFSSRDLESIESQIELHPDEEPLYVLKVRVLERMERTQDAQDWVEEALNRFPTSWELYFWRGNLIEDSPEKELESYSKSLECLQNGDETALHLVHFNKTVILLYDYRRLEEALVSASSSVEYLPSCEWGWTLKGVVLAELDRIPEALGCLDEALGLEESFALAWAAKASAVATLGPKYFEEAIEYFDKAIELDPENASTHLNRASVLAKQDKLDEALEGYSKGVTLDPDNACGWCKHGVTLNNLRRPKEALDSLRRALDLGPPEHCVEVFLDLGIVLKNLEVYDEAEKMIDKAIRLGYEDTKLAWSVLADVYEGTGREEEAASARKKANKILPSSSK